MPAASLLFLFYDLRFVRNSVAAHQKPVAIDPVRRTGQQRHQVLSLLHREVSVSSGSTTRI